MFCKLHRWGMLLRTDIWRLRLDRTSVLKVLHCGRLRRMRNWCGGITAVLKLVLNDRSRAGLLFTILCYHNDYRYQTGNQNECYPKPGELVPHVFSLRAVRLWLRRYWIRTKVASVVRFRVCKVWRIRDIGVRVMINTACYKKRIMLMNIYSCIQE